MRKGIAAIIAEVGLFSFMICIFAPFEIYLSNKDYFFFDGTEMMTFTVLVFIAMSSLFLVLLIVIYAYSKKVSSYIVSIFFGIILALYVQGNFLKNDYGLLDGSPIEWERYRLDGIISILLFCFFVVLMLFIRRKYEEDRLYRIIRIGSIYVLLIQIFTLTTLVIGKHGINKSEIYVSTTYGEMEYSTDKNFVILMLDTYESTTLTNILNDDPSGIYHEYLEDFVYYPDTSGMYRSTIMALPYLLGGVEYHNDCTYEEFLKKNYEQSALLNELQKQNWFIGIYNQNRIPNSDIATIAENCKKTKLTVSSHRRLAEYMYKLVGFRYMPQPLKRYFWIYADDIETSLKISKEQLNIYCDNNFIFNENLSDISADADRNTFHLIELFGAHPPYNVTSDFCMDVNNSGKKETGQGLLVMLNNYINTLKSRGIYDNTTIIVMGDHGKELLWNPVFLIKPAGAEHELIVDDTPFSYQTLQDLYVGIVNLDSEEAILDIISSHRNMKRRYLRYESGVRDEDDDYFASDIYECEIQGRADDKEALHLTDIVYPVHE